jgi:hypothetical protein
LRELSHIRVAIFLPSLKAHRLELLKPCGPLYRKMDWMDRFLELTSAFYKMCMGRFPYIRNLKPRVSVFVAGEREGHAEA